ncbi:MobC family replication-relaxation protein [Acinetobacter baumannii]|uniref:MobC family replication-relaxation protein n=1 Tax=Acinetobacter baumannii TaxID=470 RepID=UPI003891DE16
MSTQFIHDRAERERIKADKEEKILSFLLDETYSTSAIIASLLNLTQTTAYRTLKKMEAKDLVKMHSVGIELGRTGRQIIWGLTPTGALMATDLNSDNFKVDFYEVGRVKSSTMMHSLALQRVKVIALATGWSEWKSSRKVQQMANGERKTWLQVPDALAISPKGRLTAVELERTVKTPKRYNEILSNYATMISDNTVTEVIYICPEKIAPRLERLFSEIKKIVVNKKTYDVPESLLKRFKFITYDDWEKQEC